MSKVNIKNKLKKVIRDMLLSDLEHEKEIPDTIVNEILQNYGCTPTEKSDLTSDLNVFTKNLQIWIENTHSSMVDSSLKTPEEPEFDLSLFDKYLQAENEYCEITSELVEVLNEVVKYKEIYSQFFKDECKAQDLNIDVMSKKCQFLKLQFFLKLYGEENALKGHLALHEKLKEEVLSLKKHYGEVLEYNKRMSEIQSDKTFCELFRVYKELRGIEQRTEIIGNIFSSTEILRKNEVKLVKGSTYVQIVPPGGWNFTPMTFKIVPVY